MRYKIFGTPDEIKTDVFWNVKGSVDVDHTMLMPISIR